MSGAITLPARLDTAAAVALEARLEGEGDLTLEAGQVDMLGGLCLEILLDAIARRRAAGAAVAIEGPSDGFLSCLSTYGIDANTFAAGGHSQ